MSKGITELVRDFKILHPMAYARIEQEAYERAYKEGYDKGCSDSSYCTKAYTLDKVADRIKAKINATFDEPNYQHDGETWQNGLVMSSDIVDEIIEEIKAEIEE